MKSATEHQDAGKENSSIRCLTMAGLDTGSVYEVQDRISVIDEMPRNYGGNLENACEINEEEEEERLEISLDSDSKAGNDCEKVGKSSVAESFLHKNEMQEVGTEGKTSVLMSFDAGNVCEKEEISKRGYSRRDLEELRYVDFEEQQKRWNDIYQGLGLLVARELDQIVAAKHHNKQAHWNTNRRECIGKKAAVNSSEVCFQNMGASFDEVKPLDLTCGDDYVDGKVSSTVVEEVCDEDENSDDDYDSIQRPAFLVEGEPDFGSGPPQDGLEYLRRVRWEAAQIPKVKVVKLDRNKLNSEQTAYMPNIPEISNCSVHLLPSKHWEDAFLADFANLRQALAQLESTSGEYSGRLSSFSIDDSSKTPDNQQMLKNIPTVSAILGMDAVSRASMLRARIGSLETAAILSRVDCLWLFALCAAVDVPLDAEMGASLRRLLRKCAALRAQKSENNDEVVMLNMLVTIAGKYFGQSENRT